jgi:sporulation protein YlmC with PRC-barrel domain
MMQTVGEILDNQIRDRDGNKLGKVDGVILELRDGKPPRVAYLELGSATLARRLGKRCERWAVALSRRLGVRRPRYRIPIERVTDIGLDVEVDVDAKRSPAWAWERWWRRKLFRS